MNTKNIFFIFLSLLFLQVSILVSKAQPTPRFVDNGDNTITDTICGLMWRKSTPSPVASPAVTWNTALEKCKELNLGGYKDWRLPTIEEWATIIDNNKQFPALVEPNPFENVIVNGPYWSLTEYTYGIDYTCNTLGCPLKAHVALLYLGYLGHQDKNKRAFIWPVRSMVKLTDVTPMPSEKEQPKIKIEEERAEVLGASDKNLLFVQQGLISEEFKLQGIEKGEQIQLQHFLRMPINKNSKAILKSKKGYTEIAVLLYEIDQKRVNLFNNNAMILELPVRVRIDAETGALIFYRQP